MTETGRYNVDGWVDLENVDESGCLLASAADVRDESLLAPGKVTVAFDEDHVALACVVGRTRQGSETLFRLDLARGDTGEYSRVSRVPPAIPATTSDWSARRGAPAARHPEDTLAA